ncbi:MAG: chemotaxis protein CheD [Anaerolineaceae bacterium]|nr:chemotaxis protein CheD [Anaerolineaceae bacterium]
MYDPKLRISGLLHVVLPVCNKKDGNTPKYVDTGIQLLLDQLLHKGANRRSLIIRMAGGANMLNIGNAASPFDIGSRNIDAAHETFSELRLYVKSEEVGGQTGRTVRLYASDGRMTIRMMGGKEREI